MIDQLKTLEQGTATYGVTQFAELTAEEFNEQNLGLSGSLPEDAPVARDIEVTDVDSIDWVEKGAVTPVKNQGQCGSCWAFSTTGNIVGVTFMKTGNLVSLSEQELVDCDKNYGDMGCQGGLPSNAYKFVLAEGGIDTEASYSYSGTGGSCKEAAVRSELPSRTGLRSARTRPDCFAIGSERTFSIGINAAMMQLYMGGVATLLICNPKDQDHGYSLLVQYGL